MQLVRRADVGGGIRLAYLDQGKGPPVVFVHGSISDYTYWDDQLPEFAKSRRAIAYSRRYNWPNTNPARPGYSAETDAADLAALIELLVGGPAHVIGHSYGALTALILAYRRPDLVRTAVLAEPPAVSLLAHAPAPRTAEGQAMLTDIQANMVAPMKAAFTRGDSDGGVAAFIDYVFRDPRGWAKMPASAKAETMRDAHEWDVMMTKGELFPAVPPQAVRSIKAPVLMLSGAKSYPFLGLIDETIMSLLPNARRIVFPNANHQMWLQEPEACRRAALDLQDKA